MGGNARTSLTGYSSFASSLPFPPRAPSIAFRVLLSDCQPQRALFQALESNENDAKIEAMKQVIQMVLAGEPLGNLFIPIVRYVLPSDDHTLQKLLLLYMETIKMTDANGKMLPEMILICQNLRSVALSFCPCHLAGLHLIRDPTTRRNNLQHPNEYLRGITLRFLCRIHEEEILDPLIPSVLANLEHRHSYVRRYAAMAVDAIYRLPKGEHMLADAPEMMERFLQSEQDLSARRNAFLFLCNHAPERAIQYLMSQLDSIATWGDILQVRGPPRTPSPGQGRTSAAGLAPAPSG